MVRHTAVDGVDGVDGVFIPSVPEQAGEWSGFAFGGFDLGGRVLAIAPLVCWHARFDLVDVLTTTGPGSFPTDAACHRTTHEVPFTDKC